MCCYWDYTCHRTFRSYPEGVDQANQTYLLRKLVALSWGLGMSLRGTRLARSAFGINIRHMTVWRGLQKQAEQLQGRRWQLVRVLGIDGINPVTQDTQQAGWWQSIWRMDNRWRLVRWMRAIFEWYDAGWSHWSSVWRERHRRRRPGQIAQRGRKAGLGTPGLPILRLMGCALRAVWEMAPTACWWVPYGIKRVLNELLPEGRRSLFELWQRIPERRSGQGQLLSPLI